MKNKNILALWSACGSLNTELAVRNLRNNLIIWIVALFLTVLLNLF